MKKKPDPICTRCGVKESIGSSFTCYDEKRHDVGHNFQDPAQAKFEDTKRKKGDTQYKEAKSKAKNAKEHAERELIETMLHKDKAVKRKRDIELEKLDREQEVDYMANAEWWKQNSEKWKGEWRKEKEEKFKWKKIAIWSIVGVVILLELLILR